MGVLRQSVLEVLKKDRDDIPTILKMLGLDGGPGSGHHHHKGVKGQRGGSAPGEGGSESTESSGSSEPSYPQNRVFKGIASKARKYSNNKEKWLNSLNGIEAAEIHAQKALSGSTESNEEYFDRMYRMMVAEPGKVRQHSKPVEGKNIVDSYNWDGKPRTNEFGQVIDTQIEDVLDKQGFMGVPKVVDQVAFDKIIKEHPEMPVMFRSYSAPNSQALSDYDKQLESGEWYVDCGVGGAQYGQGMYAAGCFFEPPNQWNDPTFNVYAYRDHDFIIGADGKTYEADTPESVDVDYMDDGDKWFVSKLKDGKYENRMFEVTEVHDDELDFNYKLFRDMETGELYEEDWLEKEYGGQDTVMSLLEEVSPELPYERDYSDALNEMRGYRELNENKLLSQWKPTPPEGMQLAAYNDDGTMTYSYFDPKECKSFDEEKPKPGTIIAVGDPEYGTVKNMWRVLSNGRLISVDGNGEWDREAENQFPGERWAEVKGSLEDNGSIPQSSTRMMTLDPSAKIIDYDDLADVYGEYKKKKNDKRVEESAEFVLNEFGISGEERKDFERYFWLDYHGGYGQLEKEQNALKEKLNTKEKKEVIDAYYKKMDELRQEAENYEDIGVFAAAMGYDAINASGHGRTGSYMVILNRTKLIISEDRVDL